MMSIHVIIRIISGEALRCELRSYETRNSTSSGVGGHDGHTDRMHVKCYTYRSKKKISSLAWVMASMLKLNNKLHRASKFASHKPFFNQCLDHDPKTQKQANFKANFFDRSPFWDTICLYFLTQDLAARDSGKLYFLKPRRK